MKRTNPVSREEWLEARLALLASEKELTRQRDKVTAQRLAMPWVRMDDDYTFEGPDGTVTLGGLFEGRSQLIVQHFMFGPGWREGCVGCSFAADHVDAALVHLAQRDVTYAAVARASYPEIAAFKKRMGWRFPWVSSLNSDFNYDFRVSFTSEELATGKVEYNYQKIDADIEELPGASVFYRDDDGTIFHTYSSFGRGGEEILTTYMLLDITPLGRNETKGMTEWIRHHDRYGAPNNPTGDDAQIGGER